MLLCLHVAPCLYNGAIQCCWIIFSSAEKFWNTPTKYGPLICSNLLFEHKNARKHTKVLLFLWPWRYHLIVSLLSVFHLQKGNIFLSRGECWNVAFSASGTIQIKWNKDWRWRQGPDMMISSYDDMMILIWFHGDDRRLLKWYVFRKYLVVMVTNLKHRKNCECCPGHYLIVNH